MSPEEQEKELAQFKRDQARIPALTVKEAGDVKSAIMLDCLTQNTPVIACYKIRMETLKDRGHPAGRNFNPKAPVTPILPSEAPAEDQARAAKECNLSQNEALQGSCIKLGVLRLRAKRGDAILSK